MQTFSGVAKVGKVIDAVDENMEIDMEQAQLKNMIATYWNISKDNVKFVPVTGDWKSPYVYIDDAELSQAKQALKDEVAGKPVNSEEQVTEEINP
ncbi:Transcriptional regulator LytR [compost metagenome]